MRTQVFIMYIKIKESKKSWKPQRDYFLNNNDFNRDFPQPLLLLREASMH